MAVVSYRSSIPRNYIGTYGSQDIMWMSGHFACEAAGLAIYTTASGKIGLASEAQAMEW